MPSKPRRALVRAWLLAAALWLPQAGPAASMPSPGNRIATWLGDDGVTAGLGVNVHFPPGRPMDLQRIREAGFRVLRTDLLWSRVESQPGRYDWSGPDALIEAMTAHGLKPLLILAYSNPLYAPRLEGRPPSPSLSHAAPQEGAAREGFMRFARAAAERYRGRVAWEIWNEPDHNFGWPVDLKSYIDFAAEACRGIRSEDRQAVVMGPAASAFLPRFLEAFVEADKEGCFDAVSIHPYRDRAPEDVLGDWARLRRSVQAVTSDQGRAAPALVDSEWGYSSTGGEWTRERQAAYVARLWLLDRMAAIPLTIIYDWWDDGPDSTQKEASFGLLDHWGKPKPVHAALSRLAAKLDGLRYLGHLPTRYHDEFLLAFGNDSGAVTRVVGWRTGAEPSSITLPQRLCLVALREPGRLDCQPSLPALIAVEPLSLSEAPRVFDVGESGSLRLEGVAP